MVLLPAFWAGYNAPGEAMDEGMVLVYPELIQHGAIPYRDFETVYGPANWWFLSVVYAVFGTNIHVERTIGLLYRLGCLVSIFALTRRSGLILAAASTLLAGSLLLITGLVALSWWGAMSCALCSIALLVRHSSPLRHAGAGVLAGLAILFRVDIAPALCLAAMPILWNLNWRNRWLLAGTAAATAIVPLLVLAFLAGAGLVVNDLFFLPVFRSSPARNLPFAGVDFRLQLFFVVHLIAVVFNLAAGVISIRVAEDKRTTAALLSIALFTAGITHQPYHRLDFVHLFFVAFLSIGLLPLSLLVLARASRLLRPRLALVFSAGSAAILFLCMPSIRTATVVAYARALGFVPHRSFLIERNNRVFPVASHASAILIGEMLAKLDLLSRPGERLFVGPADLRRVPYCDTFIYHLMPKLRPGSYFLEMNPFSANAPGSRLAHDLQQADWLVLNRAWDDWPEQNRSRENGSDEPGQVVKRDFVLIEEFDSFQLFRRKSLATNP